ncbi:MAG: hypothetical protein P4L31_04820 [Candidatus Babeliales bacterium]|nr:hypothetical protein [Candidatus Babeliales bacterium]
MNKVQSMLNGKKVSDIFNEYASPVIELYMDDAGYNSLDDVSIEEMDRILQLPWLIWNAVVAKGKDTIDYLGSVTLLTKQAPIEIKEFIKFMRKRKEIKFKKYNFFLGEVRLNRNINNGQIIMTVEALIPL